MCSLILVSTLNVYRLRLWITVIKMKLASYPFDMWRLCVCSRGRSWLHTSKDFSSCSSAHLSHTRPAAGNNFRRQVAPRISMSLPAVLLLWQIQSYFFTLLPHRHTAYISGFYSGAGDVFFETAFILRFLRIERRKWLSLFRKACWEAAWEQGFSRRGVSLGVVNLSKGEDTQTPMQTFPPLG